MFVLKNFTVSKQPQR